MSYILPAPVPVAVVGAGVIGLSSALQLLRAGFDVTVVADTWTPHTTSDGAGALWERHDSDERHAAWARATYEHYSALIKAGLAVTSGVGLIEGEQYSHDAQDFNFQTDVLHFRRVTGAELAVACARTKHAFVDGCVWTSVIVDSPTYLAWLMHSIADAGGRFQNRRVESLDELAGAFSLVVNCAGLRARELAADPACVGIRGQVFRVYAPHVTRFFSTSCGVSSNIDAFQRNTYVLPRPTSGVVTCGGTFQVGRECTEIDPADSRTIWKGCCALVPELADPRTVMLDEWVGLRPGRDGDVRLELEQHVLPGPSLRLLPVIHCYGHSGCGHSLHWGCGRNVVRLAMAQVDAGSLQAPSGLRDDRAWPAPVVQEGLLTTFPREAAIARELGATSMPAVVPAAVTAASQKGACSCGPRL